MLTPAERRRAFWSGAACGPAVVAGAILFTLLVAYIVGSLVLSLSQ
jgi:hypothetical protein